MERIQFTYAFIYMYIPEYSPVEKVFVILKSKCRSHRSLKSIKKEGFNVIANKMSLINSSQIVAIGRIFVHTVNSSLKILMNAVRK